MKQTNNAIKFLIAQYRAIYKNAYFKGLMSAVLLTATVGSANAAPFAGFTDEVVLKETADGKLQMVVGETTYTEGDNLPKTIDIYKDEQGNLGLNISGNQSFNNASFNVVATDLAGYGARVGFGAGQYTFEGKSKFSQQVTIDVNNTNSKVTFTTKPAKDSYMLLDSPKAVNAQVEIAGNFTISRNQGIAKTASDIDAANLDFSGVDITLKSGKEGDQDIPGGLIIDHDITVGNMTFNDNSRILLYKDRWLSLGGEHDKLADGKLDKIIAIKSGTVTFSGNNNLRGSRDEKDPMSLTFTNANPEPESVLAKTPATVNVKISKDASLDIYRNLTTATNVAFENSGTFNIKDGATYNNQAGATVKAGGVVNVESGGSVKFTDSFTNSGTMTVANGATLSSTVNTSTFTVSGASVTSETALPTQPRDGTLKISDTTLSNYLKSTNAGKVTLNGAVVEFGEVADFSKLSFGNNAGQIKVDTNGALLHADNITLDKNSAIVGNAHYIGKNLFLLGNDVALKTKVSLTSNDGKTPVTATEGTIDGNLKIDENGVLNINGGLYTIGSTDIWTLTSGSINVTGSAKNGKAVLDLSDNDIKFAPTGTGTAITLSGADKTLGQLIISNTDFNELASQSAKGTIDVQGYGTLTVNDDINAGVGVFGSKVKLSNSNSNVEILGNATIETTNGANDKLNLGSGTLTVNNLTYNSTNTTPDTAVFINGGNVVVKNQLSSNTGTIKVSGTAPAKTQLTLNNKDATSASKISTNLDAVTNGVITFAEKSNWVFDSGKGINVSGGTVNVEKDASLTTSKLNVATGDFNINSSSVAVVGDGKADTIEIPVLDNIHVTGGTLDLGVVSDTMKATASEGKITFGATGSIKAAGATIKLDLSGIESIGIDEANKLFGKLASGTGLVSIVGEVQPTIETSTNSGGETIVDFGNIADENNKLNMTFDTTTTQGAVLTNIKGEISGGWKAAQVSGAATEINVTEGATLKFYGSTKDGNLAQNEKGTVVGINLNGQVDSALVLAETAKGNIGAITGEQATLTLDKGSNVNVVTADKSDSADISVKSINASGNLQAGKVEATDLAINDSANITAKQLVVKTNGSFKATNAKIDANSVNLKIASGAAVIAGGVLNVNAVSGDSATGKLTANALNLDSGASVNTVNAEVAKLDVVGGSKFIAQKLDVSASGTINIGVEGENSSTGSLAVEQLNLNSGKLAIDPEFNTKVATASVKTFGKTVSETSAGTINGDVYVGRNSALGVGTDEAGLTEALAKYVNNAGSLQQGEYESILYVANNVKIASGEGIILTGKTVEEFAKGTELNGVDYVNQTFANGIYMDTDTALLVEVDTVNQQDKAAVTFEASQAYVNAESGAEVIIRGNLNSGVNYNIFAADNGTVTINAKDGDNEDSLLVRSENGLYFGYLKESGTTQLTFDKDEAPKFFTAASSDVQKTLISYGTGKINPDAKAEDEKVIANSFFTDDGKTPSGNLTNNSVHGGVVDVIKGDGTEANPDKLLYARAHNVLLNADTQSNGSKGAATESVARAGAYTGAAQSALSVSNAASDLVSGRLGMGAGINSISMAQNAQGSALWLAPMYKNFESDSMEAGNLGYGVDLDFAGLALGGDYTMGNGIRIGAMFNLGSGSADGNQAASNASTDFDFFGFSLYGGYTFDKLSIAADIGYSVSDNDMEIQSGLESVGKIKGSTDASAITVGVTGQYELVTSSALKITPHAGLRYTHVSLDDFKVSGSVEGSQNFANYDASSMNVFSIPVGVTFSKDILAGDWTIKPSFDFTVTANAGDTDLDSTVVWDGAYGIDTKTSTEITENFTYGATAGLGLTNGNFGLGVSVNYTGSSSTDEYGINASARFVF